jgi:hypothetical protein
MKSKLDTFSVLSINFDGLNATTTTTVHCLQNVQLNGKLLRAFWCPSINSSNHRQIRNVRLLNKNGELEEFGRQRRRKVGRRRANWEEDFGGGRQKSENLKMEIDVEKDEDEENVPPQLMFGPNGPTLHVKPGNR